MTQHMPDIFPITRAEADELHVLSWESGHGWDVSFDWYHNPSMGSAIFVEDDPDWMRKFLSDLEGIRATEAERVRKERLGAVGPALLEALDDLLSWFDDKPSGAMQATLKNGLPAWGCIEQARTACAKAREE